MNEKILHKFLENDISRAELDQLRSSEEFHDYIKIAEATSKLQAPPYSPESSWEQLSAKINASRKKKVIPLFNYKSIGKIAAVLAVLIAGYFFVQNMGTTVNTSVAEKIRFTLPDNSEVVLNAESKIEYSKRNWDTKRKLELAGEAFFKVTSGKKFEVLTDQGTVQVIGTQFNVYSREKHFGVSCYEGAVLVSFNGEEVQLSAGNSVYLEDGVLVLKQINTTTGPTWIFDESSFENAPLERVLKELERQYGVTVKTANADVEQRFTGTFTHNNLESALKSICIPLGLEFNIEDTQVVHIHTD